LPERGLKCSILPGAVRKYKIEKPSFLTRFLLLEQFVGTAAEFEQPNPFFHVRLVCCLVFLKGAQELALFRTPLSRLPIKEDGVDPPVKLVHVHRLDAVLEPCVFLLKPGHRLFMVFLFVLVTLT
jgi:hypothetical protein